ncbi:DNA binding domain-containing protein, excisionase family [Fodinibius roseus]|uniref:DNA binding domain-containing protein, excisionase family n=1 Tax=Fodinibius roseus TaxID=1194090 RepID=A0A1M4UQA7_9BACT|nr:helix-turn-helix domain-containing protein [Fodinibius roseus]SHE58827.1 DNA binding domain-containing protein, excisionase family [Fodinibius roseus]
MPKAYITSKEELEQTVKESVASLFEQQLPKILRKAQRKEWLTVSELAELTGWSKRTIYYLKSQDRIPYSQENHRILFPTDGIEDYLHENMVNPAGE